MSIQTSKTPASARVALILAGCGAKDGSEITEAVSLLIALSQKGYVVQCFASERDTHHVVDHLTGSEKPSEKRNQRHEAARIARGNVRSLTDLKAADFDAVVIAGGFGVVKNLCNFAFAGVDAVLQNDVKTSLLPFVQQNKVCAALCIAPVVLALLCREANRQGVRLTLGSGAARDAVATIETWGAVHQPTRQGEACVDTESRFVSAPAYMYDDATPADIMASAVALVDGISTLIQKAHHSA
ncbi:MAG: isoprenoid biosynthesis glyoxalase ElbB [Pseudomonadota bacterium]